MAADDTDRVLVRQHDDVESLSQAAGADVAIRHGLVWERVLLEEPSRPALVHVRHPALVEADPARTYGHQAVRRCAIERPRAKTERPRQLGHEAVTVCAARDHPGAGLHGDARTRAEGGGQPRDLRASSEETI